MVQESLKDTKHISLHETDVVSVLDKLNSLQVPQFDVSYFLNLALEHSFSRQRFKNTPKISIMGLTMPEELIHALGAQPLWMLGGSFGSALFADKFVPRDTDSVSKANLGYIRSGIFPAYENSDLVIVPVTNDSMRKLAYMLSKEIEVFPLDVPPVKGDPKSKKKWITQIHLLIDVLQKKTGKCLNVKKLLEAAKLVNAAKIEMKKLLHYSMSRPDFMSEALVMFIINTYYFALDITEWTLKLKSLNEKVEASTSTKYGRVYTNRNNKPKILITGSPIYFPNFKIPLLFSDFNVNIAAYATEMTRRVYSETEIPEKKVKLDDLIEIIAYTHYLEDSSPAFVETDSRIEFIESIDRNVKIDGVIYHILKGQIDYDFDLPYYEDYFAAKQIPVFRLETDYNSQDIEQLRVRCEAFVEMITAKYEKAVNTNFEKMRA